MWLKGMGYFERVNFLFLFVCHTKNAADVSGKNLYTMEDLIAALDKSDSKTVIPMVPTNFFNYDALFKVLYQNLTCNVTQNNIFSCLLQDKMNLQESNNDKHTKYALTNVLRMGLFFWTGSCQCSKCWDQSLQDGQTSL